MMSKKIKISSSHREKKVNDQLAVNQELAQLKTQLHSAQEKERRAVADYQNLVRRNREDRVAMIKLASSELVTDLLQPLDHLTLAASQLNDQGLNLVIEQFWQVLKAHGLEEINPQGKEFDVTTMEAVEPAQTPSDQPHAKGKVLAVHSQGYKLNGKVLKFAQVVVG